MPAFPQYQAAIEQKYQRELERQPNRRTTLLNMIPKKTMKGPNIAFTASFGTGVGQSRAEGAVPGTYQSDDKVPAILPWKLYGDQFEITALLEDVMDGANQSIADVFSTELFECAQRLAVKIAADILTGDGTGTNMLGLLATAGGYRSLGTYANVDRAVRTQWAGNEINQAGLASYANMRAIKRAVYDADASQPDVIFTNSNQFEKIGNLPEWKDVVRIDRTQENVRGQKFTLAAGYSALQLDSTPIILDAFIPSDAIVGISFANTYIASLAPSQARVERGDVLAMVPIAGSDDVQLGAKNGDTGLYACLYKMGKIGTKTQFLLEVVLNVVSKRPKANYYQRGLT